MSANNQLEILKKRIPYDDEIFKSNEEYEQVLNDLLTDSKDYCLSILYPYCDDFTNIEMPKRYDTWQIRACIELYNMADKVGLINYSENGIVWSKLTDGLSTSLINAITPKVGIPKKGEKLNV